MNEENHSVRVSEQEQPAHTELQETHNEQKLLDLHQAQQNELVKALENVIVVKDEHILMLEHEKAELQEENAVLRNRLDKSATVTKPTDAPLMLKLSLLKQIYLNECTQQNDIIKLIADAMRDENACKERQVGELMQKLRAK